MNTEMMLAEIVAGRRMTTAEFLYLYNKADLLSLGQAANQARDGKLPDKIVTFIIDRNINYTNVCVCGCDFCAFYRDPEDVTAYTLSSQEIMARVDEAVVAGATQVMIQGGLNPALSLDFFLQLFSTIKESYPGLVIHSLTVPEIEFLARQSHLLPREVLLQLKQSGLDSLPGGGAEVLSDRVRRVISPYKTSAAAWLEIMHTAHDIGIESTATMMMGSIDTIKDRLAHLEKIRILQDETGGFRAFIAWTYQEAVPRLKRQPVTSVEYLRFMALSRLYLDNFDHIQASWLTQGKRLGQLSLHFGADDMGSIMLEENVVKAAGTYNEITPSEMIDLIKQAGFIPAQRDSSYKRLRHFSK